MLWSKSYFCRWSQVERSWKWPFLRCCFCFSQDVCLMRCSLTFSLAPTFIWWLYSKNLLHSSRVQECARLVCWMFEINELFLYAIFPCSVCYWILFWPIHPIRNDLHLKYSFPGSLAEIYSVLVLTSTNHNAQYMYPEMDISRRSVLVDIDSLLFTLP